MKTYLGKPELPPYVTEEDLIFLAADLGAGWHTAAGLYDWHVRQLEGEGRKAVNKKHFGLAMREAGWKNESKWVGDGAARCWMITNPWARRGQEMVKAD